VIYLDSSALLKLLIEEPESAALERWLAENTGTPVLSSELARVEVIRGCRRLNPEAVPAARAMLAQLDLMPLTGELIEQAADVGEALLRTLDALHLASVLSIRADVTAFVVYDRRLAAAARAAGLKPLQLLT
jgi:uncharacterized protein